MSAESITITSGAKSALLGVFSTSEANAARAAALAAGLRLPFADDASAGNFSHGLYVTSDRLELRRFEPSEPGSVYVDFVLGRAAYRRRFGGGRNQPLARAIGLKGHAVTTVIDATAGLGRDGFVLAGLGCAVVLLERSPIIAALLRDGLERAARDPEIGSWVPQRLRLIEADSRNYLSALAEADRPQTIYLDPMYPHRRKSALVKKELRVLRELAGDDDDAPGLLAAALACARRRVVVKRPRLAPALSGAAPDFEIVAPNTRFDVYLTSRT